MSDEAARKIACALVLTAALGAMVTAALGGLYVLAVAAFAVGVLGSVLL